MIKKLALITAIQIIVMAWLTIKIMTMAHPTEFIIMGTVELISLIAFYFLLGDIHDQIT